MFFIWRIFFEKRKFFTCRICLESVPKSKQFDNESKCSHPFCTRCIKTYIQIKIRDKTGGGIIVCPDPNCKNRLDPSSCKSMIGPKLFVEWCDLLLERAIPWPDSRFCPNRNCLELVVNECRGYVGNSKCPKCKGLFCFQCGKKWPVNGDWNHKCGRRNGETSEMNDVLFTRLMNKKRWVQCPGCGQCIERYGGCARMYCTRCPTSFCYKCGRERCYCYGVDDFNDDYCCSVIIAVLFVVLLFLLFVMNIVL